MILTKASLEVHTDASKLGIGAILLQNGDRGLQPIAYYSRQTSPEEQKFHGDSCRRNCLKKI